MLRYELTLNVNVKCYSFLEGLHTACFMIDNVSGYNSMVL
jgi:hypothetical protein